MGKRKKHPKKKFSIFLYALLALIVVWIIAGVLLFFQKPPASIYAYPENPKQGDTVFIRVKSEAQNIAGTFENEKLVFYKKGSGEFISFLGVDADQKPGSYKISVDIPGLAKLEREIKVSLANFSTAPPAEAPKNTQNGITQAKAISNIVTSDNPALKKALSILTPQPYFSSPFSFPLKKIEKTGFSFGKFISFAKYRLQHFGTDLKAAEKTDIFSVNDGKVVAALNLSNYGKTVIIDHGLDIFSLYLHLDEFLVKKGDIVKKGQIIGLSGSTGYVTAPHLHFSMRVDGQRVDPLAFIQATKKLDDNFMLADISHAFLNIFKSKVK